tara:strand:+ start:1855 stop:2028 length:174 start_codon:yes stop_codon:yes gene_type:complete
MKDTPKPYQEYYLRIQDTDNRKSKAVLSAYAKYRRETLLGRIADRFDRLIDIISKRS